MLRSVPVMIYLNLLLLGEIIKVYKESTVSILEIVQISLLNSLRIIYPLAILAKVKTIVNSSDWWKGNLYIFKIIRLIMKPTNVFRSCSMIDFVRVCIVCYCIGVI